MGPCVDAVVHDGVMQSVDVTADDRWPGLARELAGASSRAVLSVPRARGRHGRRILAIDDFGTGYSSLSYLDRLPVDAIKLDQSFVASLGDPSAPGAGAQREVAAFVVGLAGALGIDAVAEGVETDVQLACLQELGYDLVQGYLLGRPRPVEEVAGAALPGSS